MSTRFLLFLGLGLMVAGGIVGFSLFSTRGSRMVLDLRIQKVRTMAADEKSSILIADFHVDNPADYRYVVRTVELKVETPDGKTHEGMVVSEVDAKRVFDAYPLLGPKYNQTLLTRENLAPKQSADRMIAARFEIPESALQGRKRLTLRVEDVDGQVTEITQ